MKKILFLLSVLAFSLTLVACGDIQLDAPVISLNDSVVSWGAVNNADHYLVFIGTNSEQTSETSFDLSTQSLAVGSYDIYVVAAADSSLSLPSNSVTYVVADTNQSVSTPTNVAINSGVVSWTAVTGADSYIVSVDGTNHTTTSTSFDLSTLSLATGNHSVTVIAVSGTNQSTASTAVTYNVTESTITELDTPTNVAINNGVVSWNAVTNAISYIVIVDETEYPVNALSFDLSTLNLSVGSYDVTVVAVNGDVRSDETTTLSFTVEQQANEDLVYEAALLAIDDTYVPNMASTDFNDDYEYQNYLAASDIAQYYADEVAQFGMTTDNAIGFIQGVIGMVKDGEIYTIDQLLEALGVFETYDMNTQRVAELSYGLANLMLTIQSQFLTADLTEQQAMLDNEQADLDTYVASGAFHAVADVMYNYATTQDQIDALDMMFSAGGEFSFSSLYAFEEMVRDINNNGMAYPSNYYYYLYYEHNDVINNLYLVAVNIYTGADQAFLDDLGPLVTVINTLNGYGWNIDMMQSELNRRQNTLNQMTQMKEMLALNEDDTIMALSSVIDFMFAIKNNIPQNVVDLLDDAMSGQSELSITEIFIIKNAFVDLLDTAMPDATDFSAIHRLGFAVASSMSGMDFSSLEQYALFLGQVDEASIDLALLFIGDFSETNFAVVSMYANNLMVNGEPDILNNTDDFVALLDFLQTYIENFIANHPTEVQALTDLTGSETPQAIYEDIITVVTNYVDLMADQESMQYEVMMYALNELATSYDEITSALNLVKTIGIDVYSTFVDSQASIIDLINAYQTLDTEDSEAVLAFITQAVEEFNLYNQVIGSQFTPAQIEDLLALAKIPYVISMYVNDDMGFTLEDISDLYDAAYPFISQLSGQMIELEYLFLGDIDQTDIESMMTLIQNGFDEYGNFNPDPYDILAFLTFINDQVDAFVVAHPDQITAFNDLLNGPEPALVFDAYMSFAIAYVESLQVENPSDLQLEMLHYVLTELSESYANMKTVIDLVHTVGTDAFDQLITSEGEIIDAIMALEALDGQDMDQTALAINDLIDAFVAYHNIVADQFNATEIEAILSLVKIPMVIAIYQSNPEENSIATLDAMFESLIADVSSIAEDVFTLETVLVNAIDGLDFTSYLGTTKYTEDPQIAAFLMLVDAIDQSYTLSNSILVGQVVYAIFNDVLTNEALLSYLNLTSTQVDDMQTTVNDFITQLFDDIDTITALDYSNLSPADLDVIIGFMDSYGITALLEGEPSFEDMLYNSPEMFVDTLVVVPAGEELTYYQFTATTSGTYTITSYTDNGDPRVDLYDQNFQYVTYNDDYSGWNFELSFTVTAGQTVYFEFINYTYNQYGFNVIIQTVS